MTNALLDLLDTLEIGTPVLPKKQASLSYERRCAGAGIDIAKGFACGDCGGREYRDEAFDHGVRRCCSNCKRLQYFVVWNEKLCELPHPSHLDTIVLWWRVDPEFKKKLEAREKARSEIMNR